MRAILAGGGTGGHVIPALAIANELRGRYGAEVVFIGTARGIETRLVPQAGYPLELIQVGALKNVSTVTRLKTAFDLPRAILHCYGFFGRFKPDVIVSVGGYASGPAMAAAAMRGIPSVIFEPNLVPGFANRMAARFAKAACVHFQETCRWFRHCTVTGVPVRKAFFEVQARPANAAPSLLIFGGSQGARAINLAIVKALPILKAKLPTLRIVHQTGQKELESVQQGYTEAGVVADVRPFIDAMPQAFADADLIVCRSGASTVAEITAAGKPAIFVPFPRSADDHQTKNAEAVANAGGGVLMRESEMTPEKLAATVIDLFADRARLAAMAAKAKAMSHENAAGRVAEIAVGLIKKSGDRAIGPSGH
jgi:UDP-N-acetylglucosamine--N-acetylmuramyl-(pentapeptide) pyrophosphoryl-undecaprenol N-acetylglucosamine transferase